MKKFRLLPELRTRDYRDKKFLYNPWNDTIFELNKSSWRITLQISKGKTLRSLAHKLARERQENYKKIFKKIKDFRKELIRWGILITS